MATGLVLFMTPGLAFFYGGMVRAKNVLGMLMQNFFAMGLLAIVWVAIAFSLAFGNFGDGGFIGNLDFAGHAGRQARAWVRRPIGLHHPVRAVLRLPDDLRRHHPGADHRRHRRPVQVQRLRHVHRRVAGASSTRRWPTGCSAAAGWPRWALWTSPAARSCTSTPAPPPWPSCSCSASGKGWPREGMHPHILPLTLLGTGILWFGWFGFNAGSALAADGVAAQALMNTFLAASAAMLGWLRRRAGQGRQAHDPGRRLRGGGRPGGHHAVRRLRGRHVADRSSASSPACVCFLAIGLKYRLGYDDSLDVIGVHLVGGLVGALLLGLLRRRRRQRRSAHRRACSSVAAPSCSVDQFVASRGDLRLLVRGLVRHRQGDRCHHRAAGRPPRTRSRGSTSASTPRPPTLRRPARWTDG